MGWTEASIATENKENILHCFKKYLLTTGYLLPIVTNYLSNNIVLSMLYAEVVHYAF